MNRYTKRPEDGQAVMDCQGCPESWMNKAGADCTALFCRNRLKDRVADYEDTGLEPWEIERIRDAYGRGLSLRTESAKRLELIREIPTDRLSELVEADREGRCVVLPVKPGGVVRFAKNPRAKKETVDAITIYPDGRMSFGFHEYGVKTEWVDRWSEDDADKYVPVEAAEAALKGEQDGVH